MDENFNRMLEILDRIFELAQDVNSTLKRMNHKTRVEILITFLVMMLETQKLLKKLILCIMILI